MITIICEITVNIEKTDFAEKSKLREVEQTPENILVSSKIPYRTYLSYKTLQILPRISCNLFGSFD